MDNITIGSKIENEGRDSQGTLSAQEFNNLVNKVKELVDLVNIGGLESVAGQIKSLQGSLKGISESQLITGVTEGTAYDGFAGATLEQIVRELAGGSGTMYSTYIRNDMESLGMSAQVGNSCNLNFTFMSQYKDDLSEPYKPTGELGMLTIMVKNNRYTDFTIVKQLEVSSGVKLTQDVSEYLSSGLNSVKLTVTGENTDKTTSPLTYSVQLTSLNVSASNFSWWSVFKDDVTLPLIISGNVSKTLHVTVSGGNYNMSYEKPLGTSVYTDTPYNYIVPHPDNTGVYNISIWLSNSDNTIQTMVLSYNVMYVTEDAAVKLMCVNSVAKKIVNWQDNTLFEYSVYDGGAAYTDAKFIIKRGEEEIYVSENNAIETAKKQTLLYPMELETDDNSNFDVSLLAVSSGVELIDTLIIPVDNSLGYSATAGAVLYINPRTRSNTQSSRLSIINESDKSAISATWNNVNWSNDGWVEDSDGAKALKLLAGSSVVIDYQPFSTECAKTGKSIEIDFKVDNASNTVFDIIKIIEGTIGLKISGENVSFFSQSRQDSTTQDVPIDNDVRIRLTIVVMPTAYGTPGFNLVQIYINGKNNRQFAYESNDYFKNSGKIVLGNDYANLYLYSLRVYDNALSSDAVYKNNLNHLHSLEEKILEEAQNNVFDSEGVNIDFFATKRLFNVFVIDAPFPNLLNPSGVPGNIEVYFADKPDNNFSIKNVLWEGQGTSSKKYLEWNIRGKLNGLKDSAGVKINSVTTYSDGSTESKVVKFFNGLPKCNKITAKKNWASSMQDHKAGSVAAFTDLHKELGLSNEAISINSEVRVSVYQEPFIGFSKQVNEEGKDVYICMGEFTFGPDKGDLPTFGYDTIAFPNLISIEGSDNAPLGALFRVPWNTNNRYWAYNPSAEAFQYNEANCWDFDAGLLNENGEPVSAQKWIEAYNAVYVCSNRIKPYSGTIDELNTNVSEYRGTGYEYWTPDYKLWYYEAADGRFIASDIGNGQINLREQLSAYLTSDLSVFTTDQLNELFINARKQLFRDTIPTYFDIPDAIFHHNFTELHGGTDQRTKNTYPYNFCSVGSKWKWRLDDADTIFPIDNQGQDRKPYWCEMHDTYSNGQPMWNGETSVFWNMLELAYADEIASGMRNMFAAMERLSGQQLGSQSDKVYAFYRKYYLGVKNYFPLTIVNSDARRYVNAKLAYINGTYTNDTDPLTQSHGDFFSAETAWVKKRIIYIMSKYNYGLFSVNGTDTIVVRAAGDLIQYNIIPALDMYPSVANGTSIIQGNRTKAGEICSINVDLGGSADQQNAIQAASWLLSIGDWHDKNVSGTMVVRGKKLKELILGSKTDNVVISITGLTISDCGNLKKLLLSNISTLQGVLDVSQLTSLKEIYADGTSVNQIKLPDGGNIEKVEYPSTNAYLVLNNFPALTNDGLIIDKCASNITDYMIQNCPLLDSATILMQIIQAQDGQTNHTLKRVRAIGFNTEITSEGSKVLDYLVKLSDGSYEGLDSNGLAGSEPKPVLDGTLNINANVYEDSLLALRSYFNRLTLNVTGEYYIRFQDPEVTRICASVWGDGPGTSKAMAGKAITFSNTNLPFQGNTAIEYFNEFELFESTLYYKENLNYVGFFEGCTNLKEIRLPLNIVNSSTAPYSSDTDRMFRGCTNLKKVYFPEGSLYVRTATFDNCQRIILDKLPDTITSCVGPKASFIFFFRAPLGCTTAPNP